MSIDLPLRYNDCVTTIRAHFDGRVLVPVDPIDLPTGRLLEIDVREVSETGSEAPPGSPARLLQLMREPPHVSQEDVDELERAIEEAKLPVRFEGVFDDEGSQS